MSIIDLFRHGKPEKENGVSDSPTRKKISDVMNPPIDLQVERAIATSRRYIRRMRRSS